MNLGKPIAKGNTASIYRSGSEAIKVYNDFLPDGEARKEANKQKFAYASGLPVPEVFEVTEINGKQAIRMEYISGSTLGDLFFNDLRKAEYYLDMSVDMQINIHAVRPDNAMEPMAAKLQRQIKSGPFLDERQKNYLLKRLDSFTYESRLCHGDFHLFNVIQAEDHLAVIDWVDASSGDIRADVYRSYLLYSQFSADVAEQYLRLYCEKSGLTKSDVFQWAPVIAGARLSENVSSENTDRLLGIVNQSMEAWREE